MARKLFSEDVVDSEREYLNSLVTNVAARDKRRSSSKLLQRKEQEKRLWSHQMKFGEEYQE
ncbi:hypothetical protein [Motilimonas eburnea]|uniref:hypothetical protein n=1 Tax=Motilimonas eburnea TaxID=1737488 RepID=UPI001E37D9A4|nr:hypothetical protein [Motilimonas eburnea]MCE2571868.1 hypothetical protein [Motilimonas eburnea]